jgi:hypothetical protein
MRHKFHFLFGDRVFTKTILILTATVVSVFLVSPLLLAQISGRGFVTDTDFPSLAAACTAAKAGTLLISKRWSSLPRQTLSCNIYAAAGGVLQPADGTTLKIAGSFEGDLSRHFDLSGRGSVDLTAARIADLYPQWFGALCGGADDTTAIQETFNAASAHKTIRFTCQSIISSSVYLPATAGGTILVGYDYPAPFNNPDAAQDSLIAKKGSQPFIMLYILAPSVDLENFGIACNGVASTGILWSGAMSSRTNMEQTDRCLSDGEVITPVLGKFADDAVTPLPEFSTVLTSEIPAGAPGGSTATVKNAVLTGQILGGVNCSVQMLEYGTPRQEILEYSGNGNTLKLAALKPVFTHPAGSVIQCNGNNDGLTFNHRQSFFNQGWGRSVYPGSDNNNIIDNDFTDFANRRGGILAAGSVLGFHLGHSEGNGGPALQLGDLNGGGPNGSNGRVVFASVIEPFLDLENAKPEFNAVVDICGQLNTIQYKNRSEFVPAGAGKACAAHKTGVMDVGFGFSANPSTSIGQLSVKTKDGSLTLQPDDPAGMGGSVFSGLQFFNAAGKLLNGLQGSSSRTGALSTGKASTSYSSPQWEVNGGPFADGDKLDSGVRTDLHLGFLQVLHVGNPGELQLNPSGGNVSLGGAGSTITIPAYSGKGPLCLGAGGKVYVGDNSGHGPPCP